MSRSGAAHPGLAFSESPDHTQVQVTQEARSNDGQEPIQLPIDGVLDLHTFQPKEIKDLVPAYLAECQVRGILHVRIIHGKGIGNLRRTVHALLARLPDVLSYSLASEPFGSWGATMVKLRDPKRSGKAS